MTRARMILLLMFTGALGMCAAKVAGQQVAADSLLDSKPAAGLAILKISLRLPDDTPFLGAVSVRVMPSEGYEIMGAPGETPGDFLFPEITPGKYIVEVSAPGYLMVRFSAQVEDGHRQKTMFVVMKPRLLSKEFKKSEPPSTAAPLGSDARTEAAKAEPAKTSSAAPETAVSLSRDYWKPHELEVDVPRVDATVPCPTQEILGGVGQQMSEFVATLEKFTATENIQHYSVNHDGTRKDPETRKFEYVVAVSQHKEGQFVIDEFRNGSTDVEQFPAHIGTTGLPALALIFHPLLVSDFEFRCEGLGQWGGRQAWQLHFVQRPDRPVRIRSYNVATRLYPVHLEGRAWIDPGNNQVVRLESELAKAIPEIELKNEHVAIEYEPVQFRSTGQQIWLPHFADLYVERQGKRYYRRHTFSDFKLFNVDTTQSVQAPQSSYSFTNLSDRDINGELTVTPHEGAKFEPITLRFVVPAHGRVFKVVGPGKEVNLPLAVVASATVVHDGDDGALKVDVLLVKATTLDVIPKSAVP